jgi:hypothetical protein
MNNGTPESDDDAIHTKDIKDKLTGSQGAVSLF